VDEVKAYIETGILELYVLGDVSPEERLQVEEMMSKHPLIKAEVADIEKAIEAYAQANAVAPSENQRNKILNSIVTNFADDSIFATAKTAVKDNVIMMQPAPKANNFYKYAFAASIALLAASIVALYNMHNQLQESNMQLAILTTQNQQISKTVSFKDQQLINKDNQLRASNMQLAALSGQNQQIGKIIGIKGSQLGIFKDTSYKLIRLKPTGKVPSANMTVAWSPVKKKVIIAMAALNMPKNDKDHQYQLWALVGGKPVDLGVFDKTANDSVDMKEMKPIGNADAFAVTLEPRGGSVNPTMSELMVLGK
jgi:anti-sigma-K factor RskA